MIILAIRVCETRVVDVFLGGYSICILTNMRQILIFFVTFTVQVSVAWAHPNLQNSLSVTFEPSLVRLDISVSVKELSVAHGINGLPVNGVGRLDTGAIKRAAQDHRDYLLKHLKLSAGMRVLEGKITALISPPFFADPVQTFYHYQIDYPLGGPATAEVSIFHEMLKEWPYSALTAWNVSYVVKINRLGSFDTKSWLLPYQESVSIPTGWEIVAAAAPMVSVSGSGRSFKEYLWHGIMHILTGYDHLLFIVALVLGTMDFWKMIKVIVAFTIAHSFTLALCVLGLLRVSSDIVEPVIAISIVTVALGNMLRPEQSLSGNRLVVAFGFGLIHGLGFAGGLLDAMVGLPQTALWIALVAFSLGVEIGHQLVVLPVFGLLSVTSQKLSDDKYRQLRFYSSAVVTLGGFYYLLVALR